MAEKSSNNDLKVDDRQKCPQCSKVYNFSKPFGVGAAWEREQHLSGICSDACWDKFLGL